MSNSAERQPEAPKKRTLCGLLGDILTVSHCFLYVYLYHSRNNPNYMNDLIQYPFSTSFNIVFEGCLYSIAGLCISNFVQPFSSIILNGILSFVNYKMYSMM